MTASGSGGGLSSTELVVERIAKMFCKASNKTPCEQSACYLCTLEARETVAEWDGRVEETRSSPTDDAVERVAQALKDGGCNEDYDVRLAFANAAIAAMTASPQIDALIKVAQDALGLIRRLVPVNADDRLFDSEADARIYDRLQQILSAAPFTCQSEEGGK